jgi:hypothetical protein
VGERHLRRVLHEQVHMVFFPVELGQGRPEVRAHLRHDLFAQVDEHQVDVQVVDDAATRPSIGVWFPPG